MIIPRDYTTGLQICVDGYRINLWWGNPIPKYCGQGFRFRSFKVSQDLQKEGKPITDVEFILNPDCATQIVLHTNWVRKGLFKMKIGIISDTHDLLRPEVTEYLQDSDCILHGGDISSQKILDELEQIAPVKVVRGNNDKEWAEHLPLFQDFDLCGYHVYMTHKKKDLPKDLSSYDLAIYGHSHQYASIWLDHKDGKRTLLLNPGSCGPRRFFQPITMAMMTVDNDGWNIERIEIPHTQKESAPKVDGGDIHRQIQIIVTETEKGITVETISRKHKLDPELAEQIVRLYVTHPGVTVEGIMTKMGLLGKL